MLNILILKWQSGFSVLVLFASFIKQIYKRKLTQEASKLCLFDID